MNDDILIVMDYISIDKFILTMVILFKSQLFKTAIICAPRENEN